MRRKRRKKHPVRKLFISLFSVLLCLLLASCVFFGVKGYKLYQKAVTEKSVNERVKEIQDMDGLTP